MGKKRWENKRIKGCLGSVFSHVRDSSRLLFAALDIPGACGVRVFATNVSIILSIYRTRVAPTD